MRKYLLIIAVVLLSASCKKMMDPVRVQMPGTYWSYSLGTQIARITFPDGKHASVLQFDLETGANQALHGTYSTDGHSVLLTGDNWPNDIKFVRTFTHLKNNSNNDNMTPLSPASHENLAGSVWATMVNDDLSIAFFDYDGTCVDAYFPNANHKEGHPYGWQWTRKDYTLSSKRLMIGAGLEATLFEDFMIVDTLAVMQAAPAVADAGSSVLSGTVWAYDTSGYPGLLVFTSGSTFTRILASSRVVYVTTNGTYQLSGTELTMTTGDVKETCQLSADRFTFFEREYVKVTLP